MDQAGSADGEPTDPASSMSFTTRLEALRQSEGWDQLPFHRRLRRIRKARRWSHQQLAGRMVLEGQKYQGRTATAESLVAMLSRWENNFCVADEHNRRLLASTLEVEVADLGLEEDPDFMW